MYARGPSHHFLLSCTKAFARQQEELFPWMSSDRLCSFGFYDEQRLSSVHTLSVSLMLVDELSNCNRLRKYVVALIRGR